jgi:peptidoglycan/xylan/chitin deacetylase (PgdA/CDA1 family)
LALSQTKTQLGLNLFLQYNFPRHKI